VLYLGKETNNMKKVISTKNAPAAIGPYSQAILSNNTLYCSGQIAINPATEYLVIENITAETTQVMQNILAVLKAADMDFSNVVKCSIFMKDMNDYASINEVYAEFFGENPPAREAVQVSALPKNVNVEISVIAVK
jgi:2-iminobutanoate/2-iminopropanoate deaminase